MDKVTKESILVKLDEILANRKESISDESYVASLYEKGNNYMNGKILEEANELTDAIKNEDRDHIIHEVADLWFHCLVSLSFNDITSQDVLNELNKRICLSGLEEKKLRNK